MSQKKNKAKQELTKEQSSNSFGYLASLTRKRESVVLCLNTNTIEDESQPKGIMVDVDNYTIAFLTNDGRELLVFKHAPRFIEKVKGK